MKFRVFVSFLFSQVLSTMTQFVVIGHTDTGKSTLCGRLLKESGYIDDHEFAMLKVLAAEQKKPNYIWSWILDIFKEEMVKSKTHEYSIIPFRLADHNWTLIDTPGHHIFIRSMIGGIMENNPRIAVVLVSMLDNEFEASFVRDGMLKEHLILARAIGIENVIILANKMDQVNWSAEHYSEKMKQIHGFVAKLRFKCVEYLPVSCLQGIGLTEIAGMPSWCKKQKCLMDYLLQFNSNDNNPSKSLSNNVFVANVFRMKVFVLYCKNIVCVGYSCVLHLEQEYEVQVESVDSDGKVFLRQGESGQLTFRSLACDVKTTRRRGILRSGDKTIGYGTIEQ